MWRIIGRSSSHYTRLVRLIAEEVGLPCGLSAVFDLSSLNPDDYGGNPALKLPVLKTELGEVFGVDNICRALAEAGPTACRIVWPEEVRDPTARNAQELTWHGMQAQVQLAFGNQVAGLPSENIYFRKAAESLGNALRWLDESLPLVRSTLPTPRDISLFEASLFCLFEHIQFRNTVATQPYRAVSAFAQEFAQRPSARKTPYRFDMPGDG